MAQPTPQAVGWAIREARHDDIPQLCVMLDMLRQETMWRTLPVGSDYDYAAQQLGKKLVDPSQAILVADTGRRIVGMIGGTLITYPFLQNVRYVAEWAIWVSPAHRHQRIGWTLWQQLIAWGTRRGAMGSMYGRPKAVSHIGQHVVIEEMVWTYWGKATA